MSSPAFLALILLGVTITQPLAAQTPATNSTPAKPYPPTPPGLVIQRDIVIGKGGDRDLHADIAYPANATGPLPAVLFIHGGGWESGDSHHGPINLLARQGYFAAAIEYRLLGEAKWPAQIQDCKLGVRWLRANAAQYHVNPDRIGAWGESAGGHLVACLGTMTDVPEDEGTGGYPGTSSAVQAVIDCFGPADFFDTGLNTNGFHQVEKFLGVTFAEHPEIWKSASPVAYVKAGDPPFLIMHGDADTTVLIEQSQKLDAALTRAGVPHQFLIVKNGMHGFFPKPGTQINPDRNAINQTMITFLAKILKAP